MVVLRHMDNIDLINSLKLRYDTALQSDSDTFFFQNLHHYYDLIEKTLRLKKIVEMSEEEYEAKKGKAEKVSILRIEKFNLYSYSMHIYSSVYLPIEGYKKSTEPDEEQDPVALILLKGIKNIPKGLKNKINEPNNRWSKENLKTFNNWFEGKRPFYEEELKQFHLLLVAEIEKEMNKKPEIDFDGEKSILMVDGIEVKITLKNDKPNSHYVLEYIFENGKKEAADYVDILEKKFSGGREDNSSMYRACNDINKKVSDQAGIGGFLEIHSGKTGWVRINPDLI